jgi:hypothetical protein
MGHVNMGDLPAVALKKRRKVAVHVVEIRKRQVGVAAERLEPAARVARSVAQKPSPDRVGRARGEALGQRIVALGALPSHEGEARRGGFGQQRGDEVRDLFGRVLTVAVKRADQRRAGGRTAAWTAADWPAGRAWVTMVTGRSGWAAAKRSSAAPVSSREPSFVTQISKGPRGRAAARQASSNAPRRSPLRRASGCTIANRGDAVLAAVIGLLVLCARHACDTLHRPGSFPGRGLAGVYAECTG